MDKHDERADHIVAFLDEHNILMSDDEWILFRQEIVAALRDAVEEESKSHQYCSFRVEMARASAFEEAAKIADEFSEQWQGGEVPPLQVIVAAKIARKIRARAKETK